MPDRLPEFTRSSPPEPATRVLAIDDTPGILADYRRIFCPDRQVAKESEELDSLEAELFGGAKKPPQAHNAQPVELYTARNGEAGLAAVKEAVEQNRPIDVAFVDMRMPGGWDGVATIRRLFAADPGLQVVIATAYSDGGLQEIGSSFRRNDQLLILKKPFDAIEVRQAAFALAAKRRMTEAAQVRTEELERRVAERTQQLKDMALQDNLTGLPNRQALLEKLEMLVERENAFRAVEASAPSGEQERRRLRGFSLLFLDFNRFKVINDSLGHDVGDQLLQSIAARIRRIEAGEGPMEGHFISGQVTGHRLGGDEFVLLLEGVASVGAAGDFALRMLEVFDPPHQLGMHRCVSHPSVGMACSFRESLHATELLRDADLAMFEAKAQGRAAGRSMCVAYEGAMHQRAQRRLTLETDLRAAINDGSLRLEYQPIYCATEKRITGIEALLRWTHPLLGHVENAEILSVAEESALIHPLGRWVRKAALGAAAVLHHRDGAPKVPVHVNVSMRELLLPGFAESVVEQIKEAGQPASSLALEVSEIGIDRQSDLVAVALRELSSHGLPVILDDFGRERSSLAFLAELPLKAVKIDRFFASSIDGHPARLQVLQAIVGFANSLSLGTTACGIETIEQLAAVQAIGVNAVQGYQTGRPAPLETLLRQHAEHSGPAFRRRAA